MKLSTHLNFGGNCEEAFLFYAKCLPGKLTMVMKAKDLPAGAPRPPGSQDFVIHARLTVGDVELIGNDVPAERFQPIRSSYLYLAVDSATEAERIFGELSEGGDVGMPLAETFYATRFGQVRDRFGVLWTIIHEKPR